LDEGVDSTRAVGHNLEPRPAALLRESLLEEAGLLTFTRRLHLIAYYRPAIPVKGPIWVVVVSLLAAVSLLLVSAPAAAASACWQTVINDWADNSRVDGRYPIHCYRDALRNLPEDMKAYSTAPDDIERAMREEIRRQAQEAAAEESDSEAAPAPTTSGGSGTQPKPKNAKKQQTETDALPYLGDLEGSRPSSEDDGVFAQALDEIGPSNSSSFPLPLLVLGGITGLLLIAGGLGYLVKRGGSPRQRMH
jgi:hypothetical protein